MLKHKPLVGITFFFLSIHLSYSNISTKAPELDYAEIKELYYNSDFEKVTAKLEFYLKQNLIKIKNDSIFVFKYLGVIYASDPEFQTKGEWYLAKLISLNPNVNMDEMHLSSDMEILFEHIQKRYLKEKGYEPDKTNGAYARTVQQNQFADSNTREAKIKRWKWWVLGGGAAVITLSTISWLQINSKKEPVSEIEILVDIK